MQQMQKHGNEKCNSEKEKKGIDATDVTICCSFMMVHAHHCVDQKDHLLWMNLCMFANYLCEVFFIIENTCDF